MLTLAMGFLLCDSECREKFLKKNRMKFGKISYVASKSDWNLIFALAKRKEVTYEEIRRFEKKLQKFYRQIVPIVRKYNLYEDPNVVTILNRLKNFKEEYVNYPFSNREIFFDLRLDFYLQQIKKAALNKTF